MQESVDRMWIFNRRVRFFQAFLLHLCLSPPFIPCRTVDTDCVIDVSRGKDGGALRLFVFSLCYRFPQSPGGKETDRE